MSPDSGNRKIELRNVRVNNLKGIDLDIPHGQWLSICGLSGSGKTSLALDTLYAEGQRRYIESLSSYTRQFLQQLDKPAADRIDGIPPAIAVKAVRGKAGPRSTVGSATETIGHLRLLFAKLGDLICNNCSASVTRDQPQNVADWLKELPDSVRYQIGFKTDLGDDALVVLQRAKRNGFARVVIGQRTVELNNDLINSSVSASIGYVIVDRLKADSPINRVRESLETAFQFGGGRCVAIVLADGQLQDDSQMMEIDGRPWHVKSFSAKLECGNCGQTFRPPETKLFSFSNPLGACEKCEGLGQGERGVCEACNGSRLNQMARSFRLANRNIAELSQMTVEGLVDWLGSAFAGNESSIVTSVVPQLLRRLEYLLQVGLGYVSLDRSLASLSSGESQRVLLTTSLGATLVNMLYVLDEPSRGLHSYDIRRLKSAIAGLNDRGNTVVVVDHEAEMIRSAGRVLEIGPGAGDAGGKIVFDGTPEAMIEPDVCLTGEFLAGRLDMSPGSRRKSKGHLKIVGASGNNLREIDVQFPLGCLCVVTGVSGAGKSSLVQGTLYGAVCDRKEKPCDPPPLPYDDFFGDSSIEDVILIDQSPIGRSPRSNPVTYVKAFDEIRQTFAETQDAVAKNFKPGHFSFNVAGGRCDKCDGDGCLTVDMQFLPDVVIRCDQCHGTRFREEVLSVKYRSKNIAEVLDMTVREAFGFFRGKPKLQAKLKALIDVGLDYIRLGQPSNKLSSGEAQRLKLALYLNANRKGRSLFILDEPTSGLHMRDVIKLLDCLNALLDVGHSMVVVEHNLQFIKHADWIIDLGPSAAEKGGMVVAEGTPEQIASNEESLTGQYLKTRLEYQLDE